MTLCWFIVAVVFFGATNFSPHRLFYLYVVDIEVCCHPVGVFANTVSALRPYFVHALVKLDGRDVDPLSYSTIQCVVVVALLFLRVPG